MNRKLFAALIIVLALAAGFGAGNLYAAGNAGSQENPLITLDYLNEMFKPSLETQISAMVAAATADIRARVDELQNNPSETETPETGFYFLTLNSGEKLTISPGAEILLREGSAFYTAAALIDLSAAETDTSGVSDVVSEYPLLRNHMYIAGPDGASVAVNEGTAFFLVRGTYSVGT